MTATAIEPTPTTIAAYEGHFGWYDPRELVIDPFNHRKTRGEDDNGTEPDQALIDSIVEFGVNAPCSCARRPAHRTAPSASSSASAA